VELAAVLGPPVVMAMDARSHCSLGDLLTCSRVDAMLSGMSPAVAAARAAAPKVLLLSALLLVALPEPVVLVVPAAARPLEVSALLVCLVLPEAVVKLTSTGPLRLAR